MVNTEDLLSMVKSRYEVATPHERDALEGILAMVPVIVTLSAENARLTRVVEQAIEFGNMEYDSHYIYCYTSHKDGRKFPDLHAEIMKRDAQLKGVDRG